MSTSTPLKLRIGYIGLLIGQMATLPTRAGRQNHDWAACVADHVVRDAAQQGGSNSPVTAGAHDQDVGFLRSLYEGPPRIAVGEDRLHGSVKSGDRGALFLLQAIADGRVHRQRQSRSPRKPWAREL